MNDTSGSKYKECELCIIRLDELFLEMSKAKRVYDIEGKDITREVLTAFNALMITMACFNKRKE